MRRRSFLLATLVLFAIASPTVRSQELETGYFLGGNPYAFRMNPAFQSERNIVSTVLGQSGAQTWSNLGVSTWFYPDGSGNLYTFMNDHVSSSEFLRKIGQKNRLDLDARVNLLTVGFWVDRRFFTLDFNVRSLNAVSAPYDLFSFWKEGAESRNSYDFSGTGFSSKSFIEAAFGWSKNYGNVFNVGFRVKGLVGVAEAEILAENLKLSMTSDRWEVQARSILNASSPSFAYRSNGGEIDLESIYIDEDRYGPAGFGGAVDLGASWNVHPLLTLSAAVLDLGVMRWNREIKGVSPDAAYAWAPSENTGGEDDSWQGEVDEAVSTLSGIFRFREQSGSGAEFEMLPFRVNVGAEFRMPFYERLSVGLLYQGRGGSAFARHTGRFSLNWNPLDFLSMSTSTALSNMGESIGFALNLHPAGVNLLVGCDYLPFHCANIAPLIDDLPAKYSSWTILPRDRMRMNFYVGLNLALGRSRLNFKREM